MSIMNKLDPRIKLLLLIIFTAFVFFINRLPAAVCLLLSFLFIRLAARVTFNVIKCFKNLSLLAIFIIFIQTIFGPGENYIISPLFSQSFPVFGGMGSLKWEGFILSLVIICRLAALLIIFPVFSETTSPYSLAMGLNALGLNYRASFIVTTAFNFIPHFREEVLVIMDAQKLRGMRSFDKGFLLTKLKAYSGLALPLVLGAMRKAQSSSVAMDSRAFGVYKTRTWLEKPEIKLRDIISVILSIVLLSGILFLNHLI
ncbi:MAG: energy-coupling factor transporter transmembrane protein EcfT [Treponema sp.]|nr:energy-coupling factor transporter transmembrane protein EcfT [Treponema sp.]